MKSLLDLVACCRHASEPSESEDSRWLVAIPAAPSRPVRDRKPAAEWRPSLSAIYEDNLSPEIERRPVAAGSKRIPGRTFSSSATATATNTKFGAKDNGDGYSKYDRPMVMMPAFTPTFWF